MLSADLESIKVVFVLLFFLTLWILLWLPIGFLATWRLTSIIHIEGIADPIRNFFGAIHDKDGNIHYLPLNIFGKEVSFFAELLSCFWCLSVWIGMLVLILILVFPWVLIPFALSTVAIILEERKPFNYE